MKILILILIIVSCTTQKVDKQQQSPQRTVEIDINNEKQEIIVDKVLVEEDKSQNEITKKYNLLLITGAYDSFVLYDFFKYLEDQGIDKEINEYYSIGFGTLILSLYASSDNLNQFEWKIFKLKSILKSEEEIYSENWYKKIKIFINQEFQNTKLSDLKRKIGFLRTNSNQNKIVIKRKGNLSSLILNELKNKTNIKNKPLMWSKMQNIKLLDTQNKLDLIAINTAPQNLKMKNPDGYIWGLLTRKFSMGRDFENLLLLEPEFDYIDSYKSNHKLDLTELDRRFNKIKNHLIEKNIGY